MIPLYPGPAPGSESWNHEQQDYFSELFNTQVVTNVVQPSLTPFLPEQGNGAAVIIAPGGGFHAMSARATSGCLLNISATASCSVGTVR